MDGTEDTGSDGYTVDYWGLPTPDEWLRISGGDLPQAIDVKFAMRSRRLCLVAVRLDNGEPITSATLRKIRIGEITRELQEHIQHQIRTTTGFASDLTDVVDSAHEAEQNGDRDKGYLDPVVMGWLEKEIEEKAQWIARIQEAGSTIELKHRGRGATPPSDDEYRAFAQAYLKEQMRNEYGAKTRVAKNHHMNRSTVYRWITECQKRGLLPREEP